MSLAKSEEATPSTGRRSLPVAADAGNNSGERNANVDIVMRPSQSPAGLWCTELNYSQRHHKAILKSITMCAKPGELTVIMGASGSGKTSLINCLMSRVKRGTVSGEVGLNGEVATDEIIRTHARYVMSGDTALSYLTVEEVLFSTAQLRLPHLTSKEQAMAADEVTRWLQLDCCRKTLIGGAWRKGVSTGQLKRVAIAQELLGSPEVLVLDEPTTGLDASLALELTSILRDVARKTSKTIIASIHQPRQRAFELFDNLVLLHQGSILYHGPGAQAVNWFQSFGLKCPEGSSVPDFLLEVATNTADIHTHEDKQRGTVTLTTTPLRETLEQEFYDQNQDAFKPQYSTSETLSEIIEGYPQSLYAETVRQDISSLRMNHVDTSRLRAMRDAQRWTVQFKILWKRTTLNSMRNPMTAFIILLMNILQALILGSLFFRLNSDMKSVSTKNIMEWNVWDNDVFRYLSEGLDRDNSKTPLMDPVRDMFERGIDGQGASLVLDLANTPGVPDYLLDVVTCLRTVLPPFTHGRGQDYPQWNWPIGTIPGDDSLIERNLGVPQPERIISAVVGGLQVLDGLTKWNWEFPPIEDVGNPWNFFLGAVQQLVSKDANFGVATCCLGFEAGFYMSMIGGDPLICATKFPDITFPSFPEIPDWKSSEEGTTPQEATLLSNARQLLAVYLENISVNQTSQLNRSAAPTTTGVPKPVNKPLQVKRRQLSSGLGGLVTDLYSILFANGQMKLLKESVINSASRLKNCPNSYCRKMSSVLDGVYTTLNDIATSFLSALNFSGALLFLVGNLGFASYDVLLSFPQARAVYNKEKADGLYRSSSFLLAKMVAELPWQAVPALIWSLIYFGMIGMDGSAKQFFTYIGIVILISFAAYSLGYFISAVSSRLEVAITITPLIFLVMLILAGLMVRDPDLPKWIGWFRFLSIYRWAYFAICANQFPPGHSYGPLPNELILTAIGVVERNVSTSCLYLLLLSLGCRLASYFALVFMHRKVGLEA